MKYILLEDWSKKNKVNHINAKNWARRGRIKGARQQKVVITRWVVPDVALLESLK